MLSTKTPQQRADPMCDVLANLVWGQLGAGVLVRRRAGKDLLCIACVFCNILFYREQAHEEKHPRQRWIIFCLLVNLWIHFDNWERMWNSDTVLVIKDDSVIMIYYLRC